MGLLVLMIPPGLGLKQIAVTGVYYESKVNLETGSRQNLRESGELPEVRSCEGESRDLDADKPCYD